MEVELVNSVLSDWQPTFASMCLLQIYMRVSNKKCAQTWTQRKRASLFLCQFCTLAFTLKWMPVCPVLQRHWFSQQKGSIVSNSFSNTQLSNSSHSFYSKSVFFQVRQTYFNTYICLGPAYTYTSPASNKSREKKMLSKKQDIM